MLFLILSILSSSLVSVIMRLSNNHVKNNLGMLTVNYIACSVLAGFFCNFFHVIPTTQPLTTLGFGFVNGVLFLAGFVLIQMNIQKNGVVLSSIFQKLGLLVTMVVSVVCYREMPSVSQGAGFLLALAAIFVMNYQKDGANVGSKGALFAMLLACGMADAMSKVFAESGPAGQDAQFLFYTFFVAIFLCWGLMAKKRQRIGLPELIYGTLIALPNFFATKFLLRSLGSLSAVIVYPVYSIGSILTVTMVGLLLFHERPTKRQYAAIGIILVALVLLNV